MVLRYYEDEVATYALERTKKEFTTKVEVAEVKLTFWKTFPNVSLQLSDVYIEETFAEKDTLLFARSVFLKFNLIDLFRSNYNIHAVTIDDAKCEMRRDATGADNWHFWKEDTGEDSQFKMALQELNLNNSNFLYSDKANDFLIRLISDESTGEGNFSSNQFDLKLDLSGTISQVKSGLNNYAVNKVFKSKSTISADTKNSKYDFQKCTLEIEKMAFEVNGGVSTAGETEIDLSIIGSDLKMEDLMGSLSSEQQKKLSHYAPSGDLNLDIRIATQSGKKKATSVDAHCVLRDGEISHDESGLALDNLSCDVRYSNSGKTDQIKINSLQCNLEEGFLQGKGIVSNLEQPVLDLNLDLQMDLQDVKKFFSLDTLEICQGKIGTSAHVDGTLKYLEADSAYDWRSLLASGSATLSEGLLRLKNSNREFKNLEAKILFDKKDASIQNLSGVVNGSDFRINGTLSNLLPFLTSKDESLKLDASLTSELIDFTNLVETESSTSSNNNYKFELPQRINFDLKTQIKKFTFRKFEANNVKGVASLQNQKLTVDPVAFRTADGDFKAQIVMERSENDMYRLNCLATLQSINVQKLFTEFENFGQTFIQDKHLQGSANATVQFRTMLTDELVVVTDRIESLIDISIVDGALNNLESLQEIAAYIKSNKLIAPFVNEEKFAEKMKNISFSKLENVIEIKNRMVTIPLMDIHSSAMDISAKGSHTFDNQIDYAIGFNLRDVLVRKEKAWTEVDDGLGKRLFVSMKGTTDDPVFQMDKELAKEVRQDEMQAEKANVKALLKQELGLFKRDNSLGTYQEKKEVGSTSTTTLEWEDADVNPDSLAKKVSYEEKKKLKVEPEEKLPKKKVPKWMEEKK